MFKKIRGKSIISKINFKKIKELDLFLKIKKKLINLVQIMNKIIN